MWAIWVGLEVCSAWLEIRLRDAGLKLMKDYTIGIKELQ